MEHRIASLDAGAMNGAPTTCIHVLTHHIAFLTGESAAVDDGPTLHIQNDSETLSLEYRRMNIEIFNSGQKSYPLWVHGVQ